MTHNKAQMHQRYTARKAAKRRAAKAASRAKRFLRLERKMRAMPHQRGLFGSLMRMFNLTKR